MKLVQILARELREWPRAAACVTQDKDKQITMPMNAGIEFSLGQWDYTGSGSLMRGDRLNELATDHATAIVTRPQWEAEKARIAGKVDGGWKRHRGGKQPVADGVRVDYRMRNGRHGINEWSELLDWGRSDESPKSDIMAYRIHKPTEQAMQDCVEKCASTEAVEVDGTPGRMKIDGAEVTFGFADDMPAAQYFDGPIKWRDRIYELDTQRAELEATYQRQIREIDGDREWLVAQLKAEGLALVEVQVQPVEDMSDWRNWKAGDLVRYDGAPDFSSAHFTIGNIYKVSDVASDAVNPVCFEADDSGEENGWRGHLFKFVSRPAS